MTTISNQLRQVLMHLSTRFGSASDILEAFTELGVNSGNYFWSEGNETQSAGWIFESAVVMRPFTDIGLSRQYFEVSQNSLGYCVRVGNNHFADIYMSLGLEVIDVCPDAWASKRCWAGMSYNERQQWCKAY